MEKVKDVLEAARRVCDGVYDLITYWPLNGKRLMTGKSESSYVR